MVGSGSLDSNSSLFLERSLRLGRVVLFTGAGFSHAAKNIRGSSVPLGSQLKEVLWEIAFAGEPLDPESSLGEVFDIAVRTRQAETGRVLRELLTVDAASIPDFFQLYFRVPWYRMYTLNLDTLISAGRDRFRSPEIRVVSALRDQIPDPETLSAVHLNGTLDEYPNVTFSPPQYGQRAAHPDYAYASLVRDLYSHCIVFIGTQLEEPPLWQHVAMRGARPPGRELRPRSFLISPSVSVARAAMLERYNVEHVALSAEEFAEFLKPVAVGVSSRPFPSAATTGPLVRLDAALREPAQDLPDFLLGREPSWPDITEGFAVERTFEANLLLLAKESGVRTVLLYGTAGSGKSTSLRRLALTLQAEGKEVEWLRFDAVESVAQLQATCLASSADVVAVDRAERFGRRGVEFVRAVAEAETAPQMLASYTSTAFDELGVEDAMQGIQFRSLVVPLLDDEDIRELIQALTRANRLGRLAGLTADQQFAAFKERAHRQLLVAMLEATSGQRFEEKIATECEALAEDLVMAYAVTALATQHHYRLAREDLLAALSDVSVQGLQIEDRLVRQHLVLRSTDGRLAARHPVIAREVITFYRRSGQLGEAIARLSFVLASKFYPGMPRTPERRLLTQLTSHEYLGQAINSRVQVRSIYEDLEPLLRNDPHYWLQRGSYELERGDLRYAEVFLSQARGFSDGNYMIDTEWAYLMLERACRDPRHEHASKWFDEGLEMLLDVIERLGPRTVNTYVVLAGKAVEWSNRGPLSLEDRKKLLGMIRAVMADGSNHHQANRYFSAARTSGARVP